MLTAFVYSGGETRTYDYLDPAWIMPGSGEVVWVDLADPSPEPRIPGQSPTLTDSAAWAAASLATGTRYGEQLTYFRPTLWKK